GDRMSPSAPHDRLQPVGRPGSVHLRAPRARRLRLHRTLHRGLVHGMWPMGTEGARRRRLPPRLAERVDGARRFRAATRAALADLPPALSERMDNVDVIVRGRPTAAELRMAGVPRGGTLLGLYHGTPLTARTAGYNMTLPDRIYLFRQPLE